MGLLTNRKQKEYLANGYDLDFLKEIQPQGNMNFKPDDYYFGGDGYYTILHVFGYPTKGLENFWMLDLMQISGTRAFLSIYRENNNELKEKLKSSIDEKSTRISGNARAVDNQTEVKEISDMAQLYSEIEDHNIAMMGIYIRIFVTAITKEKLFEKVQEIKDKTSKYKMGILTGELDLEYQAPFIPPSKQIEQINHRRGITVSAYALAGGYFYNHTKLEDQHGSYFGYTPTNGAVNFNFLERDNKRTRSFMLISGNPKMGQKTFSLKMNDDLYAKGHYIRNFDANGTFSIQTQYQNGLMLNLSGSENRINPFQVFPTVTNREGTQVDEIRSFQLHIEKLKNMFYMLNSAATDDDMTTFEKLITSFYISKKIWFRNPNLHESELRATKINKDEYPRLSDFNLYISDVERQLAMKRGTNPVEMASITRIKNTFETMLQTHGGIFEGSTEFMDISNEKVVTFDFSGLKGQPNIFNAQVFSVLSLISADITNNGKRGKQILAQNPNLNETDLPHYIVNISDAQNIITPKFARSVDLLAGMMDGMGDNFAAIILSVNSLQNFLVSNNTGKVDPYTLAVQSIFGMMQYRVFAQTSETDVQVLANALSGAMNQSELETLPRLSKGQLFMNIAGVGNIVFNQQLMPTEVARYGDFQ
ncbi:virulence factor [Enterococcus diestrammenae]|uniref:Virulence factor n=1 Tax=Enterococcus diestrammenae TaxID=1155073 RepID=A0ABV0F3Y2_9ENTE|nr:virulence factor [Enterococcus diestrammenae]KAF1298798.1 virulence factor [Enterococcus diestrammenae]